ncbi:MAG TPA: AAA family ATPase [Kofleriaceae bacterium]|nr:AAA family ATPase [Kofleriaceae bacterium]
MAQEGEFAGTERFEVQRRLGAGGMGVVYQAYDRERSTTVALKTLRRHDAGAIYRFKREFRGLADINHPNLATLHELVSAGDDWFFTMELVEGVDFITWVRGRVERPSGNHVAVGPVDAEADTAGSDLAGGPTQERPPVVVGPRPSPPPSFDRLRDALRQLAEGVQVLHQANKLHRDIKPSNVMVDRAGRVVLLDFGLMTELATTTGGGETDDHLVGTADYMSPEQGASLPLGPASDWYAVGTVLFRALTGVLPFNGPPITVLMLKQQRDAPPPESLVPGAPADLCQLCTELLRRDPSARPEAADVLRRLGSSVAPAVPRRAIGSRSQSATLIGRGRHADALREAFAASRAGSSVTMLVHGRSGMGKSVLIEHVTRELVREHAAVALSRRCYERESVPYKALDSLVDALSRHLAQLARHEAEALLPRDVLAVARLFPVLRRVDAVASAPRKAAAPDPHELRRRGVAALRDLLARMAERRPLVLCIDDLQWGDLDSTSVLVDLLRPPDPPALLLVLSYRSEEAEASQALRQLVDQYRAPGAGAVDLREIEVGALGPEEARQLALARLGRGEMIDDAEPVRTEGSKQKAGAPLPEAEADLGGLATAIAREAAGDPFLIDQLVRFIDAGGAADGRRARRASVVDVRFEEVMRVRLGQLAPEARRALELVAVAGRPLPQRTASRAAAIARDEQAVFATLRAGSLLRTSGAPELGRIETYHDRVREAVVATLTEEAHRERHLALAGALEASDQADPEALAQHYLAAGVVDRGSEYAVEAAVKAAGTLAFERAAVFYRMAIDSLPADEVMRRRLRVALGDALANAGRGADAAAEYLAAAEGAAAAEALELRRRAAEQLLRCGHLDDGLRALETVLGAVGMRLARTPRRALWSLVRRRMRARMRGLGFTERDPSQVSAEALTRVDICWSVAAGLGLTDTIRGADFQTRHLLLALAAGEPYRISRALAMEAAYSSVGGQATWKRTEKLLAMASEIAGRIDQPHARGLAAFASALASYQAGQWRAGLDGFEKAAVILREQCTGVAFEIASALRFALDALFNLGELGELCRRVPQYLREAERRGDMYGATDMRTGLPNAAWLVADDPDTARAECARGRECWSQLDFYLQHYYELLAQTHIDLYIGDGATAYQRVTELWPKLESSMLLRIQAIRGEALFLRGRAALAANQPSDARAALRELDDQAMPGAHALANLLEAGVAHLSSDTESAARLLNQAESRFRTADMNLCAAAVRRRRGELIGGAAGARAIADAERWMLDQTIRNPASITRLILGW